MSRNDPLASELLLEIAKKLIDEDRIDSISAKQLDDLLKEFRTASEDKLKTFLKRLTPEIRYKVKREYNRFVKGGYAKTNPGLAEYRLKDLKPKFRKELENAVTNSLSLIKTQNEQTMLKLEQRFRSWALVPTKEMRKSLTDKTKQMQGFRENVVDEKEVARVSKKHLQFVITDQYRKMISAMDQITADENGAVGFYWRTRKDNRVVGKPGGMYPEATDPKMHGDHYDREGKFYLYKDTWATKNGYVIPRDGVRYSDSLSDGLPGIPIGCRCLAENVYSIDRIPKGCVTEKGKRYSAEKD